MPITVEIPEVGEVEFPDGMSQSQITEAIERDILGQTPEPPQAEPPAQEESVTPSMRAILPGIGESSTATRFKEPPPVTAAPFGFNPPEPVTNEQTQAAMERATEAARVSEAFSQALSVAAQDPDPVQGEMRRRSILAQREMAMEEMGVGVLEGEKVPTTPKLEWQDVQTTLGTGETASKVIAGAQQAITGAVDFFLTPEGIATLGVGSMSRAAAESAAKIFVADMALHSPQQMQEVAEGYFEKDAEKLTRGLVGLGLTGTFIAKGVQAPRELEMRAAVRELENAGAPLSAQALEQQAIALQRPGKADLGLPETLRKPTEIGLSERPSPERPEMLKAEGAFKQMVPKTTILQALPETLEAAKKAVAARERRTELQSPKLSTGGQEFRSVANTPEFLQTAEQRIASQRVTGQGKAKSEEVKPDAVQPKADEPVPALPEKPVESAGEVPVKETGKEAVETQQAEVKPEASGALFTPDALQTPVAETMGLRAGPAGLSMAPLEKFGRKWFTTEGLFPESIHKLKGVMEAEQSAINREVKWMERDFMDALREVYKFGKLEELGGASRRIPPEAVRLMDDYLKGQVENPNVIPAPIRGVLDNMRAQITNLSERVMGKLQEQLGRLEPDSAQAKNLAALIETVQNNMDVYVHRSYKFFDSKKSVPEWYEKNVPPAERVRAEDYIMGNLGLDRNGAKSWIQRWLSDLKGFDKAAGSKLGSMDLSQFMRRKPISPELRAVLGEYRSPLVNYAKSVTKMSNWLANQKFLEEVREAGLGRFLFEEGADPPGFNTRIAAEGSESMSPLNGLRTTPEIAEAFALMDKAQSTNPIWRLYLIANAQTKIAATVQSILTQQRNLLSRPLMALMAGHWDFTVLPRSIKHIYNDIAGNDAQSRAYMRSFRKSGAGDLGALSGEARALARDAGLEDVSPADFYSWNLGRFVKKVGWEIPQEIYRASDTLGNVVGWEIEKANVRKVHPEWSQERIEMEAGAKIREIYPNYDLAPQIIKEFRKLPIGPFVMFPYQIMRTTANSLSLAMTELKSTNPVERRIGAKRLTGIITALGSAYAFQEASKAWLGISTAEEDDFRLFQPPWAKNSKWMFTAKDPDTGEITAVNLSYIDPYSVLTDPVMGALSGMRIGEPATEMASRIVSEFFRPYVSEQMLAASIFDISRNKTETGREIYNETDPDWQKSTKSINHVFKTLLPGTVQRLERRIIPAFRDEQPPYGRKLEPGTEIARELTGVALEKFSFKTGLSFKARDFIKADSESEDHFRRTATRSAKTTDQEVVEAYQESDRRRFEHWKEMRRAYLAAIRRGVQPREAISILRSRGVGERDANLIRRGVYQPMEITDTVRKRAREVNRQLPIPALQQYQSAVRGISLDQ